MNKGKEVMDNFKGRKRKVEIKEGEEIIGDIKGKKKGRGNI